MSRGEVIVGTKTALVTGASKGIGRCYALQLAALGYNVLGNFHPFAPDSFVLDLWDFILSYNLLPIGALVFCLFCCFKKFGWGWDNFMEEVNAGKGMKLKGWMRPIFTYFVPVAVVIIYVMGLVSFKWK